MVLCNEKKVYSRFFLSINVPWNVPLFHHLYRGQEKGHC